MSRPLETTISIQQNYGRPGELPNIVVEKAQFWQRPNFEMRINRFKEFKREFNIYVPDDAMGPLMSLGYPVKALGPRTEEEDPLNFLNVRVDLIPSKVEPDNLDLEYGADIWILQGDKRQKLNSKTAAMLDTSKNIEQVDMEIRAWEYDRVKSPGQYSARLVTLVAVMRPNMLMEKYGNLG